MKKTRTGELSSNVAPKQRVLIADDDPLLRETLKACLNGAGFQAILAEDGGEARDLAADQDFDLMVIDLGMPGLDGYELLKYLRQHPRTVDLPVIVVTSSGDQASVEKAYALGASSFVCKPINLAQFAHHAKFVVRSGQTERHLRRAQAEAELASRVKNGLFHVLSHELKTPLVALVGMTDLLAENLRGLVQKDEVERLEHVSAAALRLNATMSDVLVLSKALAGRDKLAVQSCDAAELLDDCLAGFKSKAKAKDLRIRLNYPEFETTARIDMPLLRQGLAKLIDNAIKFSPSGSAVDVRAVAKPDGTLVLSVEDHGPGISPKKLAACLQPFVQGDMSYARPVEGLGLGLPIAKAIAEAHGGELVFQNAKGRGFVAAICLPAGIAKQVQRKSAA